MKVFNLEYQFSIHEQHIQGTLSGGPLEEGVKLGLQFRNIDELNGYKRAIKSVNNMIKGMNQDEG